MGGRRFTLLTHADLVERAARWLRNTKRCGVVLTECSNGREIADAMGWNMRQSLLVECKTSRADFLRDRHKPTRRIPELGCGNYRYYMTPRGLLRIEELPEKWGLLEIHGKIVRVVKKAESFSDDGVRAREFRMLYSQVYLMQEKERLQDDARKEGTS
jgi:hypothetical protein